MLYVIPALLLLCACSPPETPNEAATATAAPDTTADTRADADDETDPDTIRARFIVARDGETILIEEFTRAADRIESEITSPASAERSAITYTLAHDATISRVQVSVTGGESRPQRLTVDIARGQAIMSSGGGSEGPQQALLEVPQSTMALPFDESIVGVEQLIRRARVIEGSPVEIPILPRSMQVGTVTLEIGAAMAIVRGPEIAVDAEIDADGNITSATELRKGLTITRSAQ